MAIRQYIGARYVTKIYENSNDPSSAEWEASVNYEPLTMVTYNNGSYLSKKEVPGSIGDPASNPTYWAQTGFYNGQIAYLDSKIGDLGILTTPDASDLANAIESLNQVSGNHHKIITIGDSYNTTDQTSAGDYVSPWGPKLANLFGLTAGVDWFDSGISGTGFVNGRDTDTDFIHQLMTIGSSITNKETITDIVVAGGTNDTAYMNDLYTAIPDFTSYCKQHYPNAKVWIFYVSWIYPMTATSTTAYNGLRTNYGECSADNACIDVDAFECLLQTTCMCQDRAHPNGSGASELAKYMHNRICGGKRSVQWVGTHTYTGTGVSQLTGDIKERQNGSTVTLEIKPTTYNGASIAIVGGNAYQINLNKLDLVNPVPGTVIGKGTGYVITDANKVIPLNWRMEYTYQDIKLYLDIFDLNGAGYFNGNVTYIRCTPSMINFSANQC